jgi:uncharacterized protein YdcH (DUF465 family)
MSKAGTEREKELTRLEHRHRKLKAKVAEYEARTYLTPAEQAEVSRWKKEKLATKDQIDLLGT